MASIAQRSSALAGLFEAEVLTELLLWRWDHPLKNDRGFKNDLLESAASALKRAVGGQQLLESVPASETNLIAAIYYAEWVSLEPGGEDPHGSRQRWLENLRRALPSCFCAQEDLPPT